MMGYNQQAQKSSWGLPKAQTLYGPLPQQLKDPNSFSGRLKHMLKVREDYGIHVSEVLAVPDVKNPGVFLLVIKLPKDEQIAITAINFSRSSIKEKIDLTQIKGLEGKRFSQHKVEDVMKEKGEGTISQDGSLSVKLDALKASF